MRTDRGHGSPYDRGAADSWYMRPRSPHYYVGASYGSKRIERADMTREEIAEYFLGYEDNEASGGHKDYG